MQLKDQVVSLELSKRLKELGVEQDSLWVWANDYATNYCLCLGKSRTAELGIPTYSAFTVSELGEMLPKVITSKDDRSLYLHINKGDSKWWYICYENDFERHFETEKTEADARAKMLIYLIENNLLK